jgi:hypothetical protein
LGSGKAILLVNGQIDIDWLFPTININILDTNVWLFLSDSYALAKKRDSEHTA